MAKHTIDELIKDEEVNISKEARESGESKIRRIKRTQIIDDARIFYIVVLVISLPAIFATKQLPIELENSLRSLMPFIQPAVISVSIALFVFLVWYYRRGNSNAYQEYRSKGIIADTNIGYFIKPMRRGAGYIFATAEGLVLVNDKSADTHDKISYQDIEAVLYEPAFMETLILIFTRGEVYAFSTTGRMKSSHLDLGNYRATLRNMSGAFIGDLMPVLGRKMRVARLGLSAWSIILLYLALMVSFIVFILLYAVIETTFFA